MSAKAARINRETTAKIEKNQRHKMHPIVFIAINFIMLYNIQNFSRPRLCGFHTLLRFSSLLALTGACIYSSPLVQ